MEMALGIVVSVEAHVKGWEGGWIWGVHTFQTFHFEMVFDHPH